MLLFIVISFMVFFFRRFCRVWDIIKEGKNNVFRVCYSILLGVGGKWCW